jgi:DNA replication and repair protein RecF
VLRLVRERRQPASALDPWTEQMLDWGSVILRQRLHMLAQIQGLAGHIFRDLAGTDEQLRICYRSTALPSADETASADHIRGAFRSAQTSVAAREIEQAVSLIGPHRDDFTFVLDDIDLNTYGSRGQQRLAVLALKLAEAEWMRGEVGEVPVVLLDDVLSELDPHRRGYVLQRLAIDVDASARQRQVWITTTEMSGFSPDLLGTAQSYIIDAGRVRRA